MKIIADANMPGLDAFAAHGELQRVEGRQINPQTVADADVLLVRSVTRVDATLLANSPVRFVGSATIGTDHVDRAWLADTGRVFAHAPGCNARAVAEYVLQALLLACQSRGRPARGLTAAVIGMGNVGSRVAQWLSALGLSVRCCDPPLQVTGKALGFPGEPLDALLDSDVLTLHVPLTVSGAHPTLHLLDERRLAAMGPERILINTCRGPVVDNQALEQLLRAGKGPLSVLDVWETEPLVPARLLSLVEQGSPHIAGYSVQGKLNGTRRVYDAFCQWLNVPPLVAADQTVLPPLEKDVESEEDLLALLQAAYCLPEDDRRLKESLEEANPAAAFDQLRKQYPLRQEMHCRDWQGKASPEFEPILNALFAQA